MDFIDVREEQEFRARQEFVNTTLDNIKWSEGIHVMVDCAVIMGLFRESKYYLRLGVEDMVSGVSDGKWFGSPQVNRKLVENTVDILKKYSLLLKFPDDKYAFRDNK